jgi:hypothetical protein
VKSLRVAALLAATLFASAAHAEQFVRDGEFLVHYAALQTTELTPEVARQFEVTRSKRRILLVLNAQKETAPGRTVPQPATASGTVRNLIGHVQPLKLRPIREGEVHYVIADAEALDGEYLVFDVQVLPEGAARPLAVQFKQQFYQD